MTQISVPTMVRMTNFLVRLSYATPPLSLIIKSSSKSKVLKGNRSTINSRPAAKLGSNYFRRQKKRVKDETSEGCKRISLHKNSD